MVYDTIVLGLGAMGSATAYHLATRGVRVLGLEQFGPAHDRGSSHGESRIIRQAYFEDPAYVPLVLRAYELWRDLERETGADLLAITGGLMLGTEGSPVIAGSLLSAQTHNLPHEMLDAGEIRRRFPPFAVPDDTIGLYENEAGALRPEACIRAHLDRAAALGATLHFNEPALRWEPTAAGGVRVTTATATYEAEHLVITAGAWAPVMLADLGLPLVVERQLSLWFEPVGGTAPFTPGKFPIYVWDRPDGVAMYGFPALNGASGGVKFGMHHGGIATTADTIDREIHAAEVEATRAVLRESIPSLNGPLLRAVACMYTNTPDEDFVIAHHPTAPQVTLAAGFSGHGFKFAAVVGEILADLTCDGTTRHPIGLFTPSRFA